MRLSSRTVVYTGAGISASAVGQAALSGTNKVGWTGAGTSAQPTPTHHALAALGRSGWIHSWIQQNHDGLPQKAGFPQERICEVHGSWFDPSNPVVKYSGSLKEHECEWMEEEAAVADLVLVLGTSLGGLFADQMATDACERAARGASLGAVIINLQQTEQDGKMTLNIFGKSDDVLQRLLAALDVQPPRAAGRPRAGVAAVAPAVTWPEAQCVLVPYGADGQRLPAGVASAREECMWLDLRPGAKVRLNKDHNHQNAKQPNTMHIGARPGQTFNGKELRNVGPGVGTVVGRDEASSSIKLLIEGAPMKLGIWWLEAAGRGGPAMLPVVNVRPLRGDAPDPSNAAAASAAARPQDAAARPGTNSKAAKAKTAARSSAPRDVTVSLPAVTNGKGRATPSSASTTATPSRPTGSAINVLNAVKQRYAALGD